MVWAQDALTIGQNLLEQGNSLFESTRGLVGVGEVVARGQGVGVVGSQDALTIGQGLLEQVDGLVESARGLVGVGEVVARGQGVGVVGSQGLIEEVHGVGQGQGGLRTPKPCRVLQGVREGIRGAGVGEQAPGVGLPSRRAQLFHQIEGLATAGTVRNRDGGDVHRPQEPGGRLLDPFPVRRFIPSSLPDHATLKPVDHHFGTVL